MLRTNFESKKLPQYEEAVALFKEKTGSDRLNIKKEAYIPSSGALLDGYMSLHDNEQEDLSPFWRIFESLKEKYKK